MSSLERAPAVTMKTLRSPAEPSGCYIAERLDSAFLDLRGNPADPVLQRDVQQAAGLQLPRSANTFHQEGRRLMFWAGPDQWLLTTTPEDASEIASRLCQIADSTHQSLTDISSGYTQLDLSGENVDAVVRSATPFDVAQLSTGRCAQTVLAKAQVLLWKPAPSDYGIVVRRSFANYLCRWLIGAGAQIKEA